MKLSLEAQKIIETLKSCSTIGDDAENHYIQLINNKNQLQESNPFQLFSDVFKALGNNDRILILMLLNQGDKCVCELEGALAKSQPSISRHLKVLEDAHLIQGWKKGKFTHYSLIRVLLFKHSLVIGNCGSNLDRIGLKTSIKKYVIYSRLIDIINRLKNVLRIMN